MVTNSYRPKSVRKREKKETVMFYCKQTLQEKLFLGEETVFQ